MTWTCSCGREFTSWGKAEKHARLEHQGGRIVVNVKPRKRA